jgi:hypothetical protein
LPLAKEGAGPHPSGVVTRLRSFVDHTRFRVSMRARLVLDIVLTAAGVSLMIFSSGSTIDLIGGGISVASALLLVRDLRRRFRQRMDFRLSPNPDFSGIVSSAEPAEGYVRVTFGGTTYVTSDQVNTLLDGSENGIDLIPERYRVPDNIWEHFPRFLEQHSVADNQRKVRLRTDITTDLLRRGRAVAVQYTDYFSGVATNDNAMEQIEHCGDDRRRQRWSLLFAMSDLVIKGSRLIDLEHSVLSNHIGITALLITSDHCIVYQQQGDQAVDSRCLNLGSSGSLDDADLYHVRSWFGEKRLRTLQDALRRGMEREAAEETSAAVGPGKSQATLTGFARYLDRGGKPEFFGIVRTASKLSELRPSGGERFVHGIYSVEFAPTRHGLIEGIDELLGRWNSMDYPYSPSMKVGLRLARSHVERSGIDLSPFSGG